MAHLTLRPGGMSSLRGCIFPEGSWLANMLCGDFAAQVYEEHQYGVIPKPIPPEPPAPPTMAPSGQAIYSGYEVIDLSQSSLERTRQAYQGYVDAQAATGSYHPEGQLPMTAEELEKFSTVYGPWLLAGGGILILLLLTRR